jgi:hypothetical protein
MLLLYKKRLLLLQLVVQISHLLDMILALLSS